MNAMTSERDTEVYQLMMDSVRELADSAIAEQNGAVMLERLAAVGTIATGLKALGATYESPLDLPAPQVEAEAPVATEEEPMPEPEPSPTHFTTAGALALAEVEREIPPPRLVEPLDLGVEIDPPALDVLPVVADPEEETASESELVDGAEPEAEAAQDDFAAFMRKHYPALELNERQLTIFRAITETDGVFKAGVIIGKPNSIQYSARSQALRRVVQAIEDSRYAADIHTSGRHSGTKYEWRGKRFAADEELADGQPDNPVPLSDNSREAPDQPGEPEQASQFQDKELLAFLGIDLNQNGHNELSAKGIPLKLSAFSVELLLEIARNDGKARLPDLVRSAELKALSPDVGRSISESRPEIERVLKQHGIDWRDVQVPVDGKVLRTFTLGDIEQRVALKHRGNAQAFLEGR